MTRIGCRAHDYGKLPAAALAATLRAKGYNAAQLAMPRAIAGIEDFSHITDKQLAEIRTAFAAQDVEISVLSCYQDLSAPDADTRRTAVDTVKRTLGCAKLLGAKMVGSETAWGACTDEEKAVRRPLMLDSIARITEEAARLNVVFAVESVDVHPLCTPELLRTVLDTAADIQHCKVILTPSTCSVPRTGRTKRTRLPTGAAGWRSSAVSSVPYTSRTAASRRTAAKRCCRWARAIWIILPFAPSWRTVRPQHRCCAMRLFCPPTPPMCGICAG